MSSQREVLAARRQVLVARAALQRLEVRQGVGTLRESLRWPRAVASLTASPAGRSALFGALLLLMGRGRLARVLRIAAGALVVAKVVAMAKAPQAPAERARDDTV